MPNFKIEFEIEVAAEEGLSLDSIPSEVECVLEDVFDYTNLRVTEISDYDPKYTTYGGLDPKAVIKHG